MSINTATFEITIKEICTLLTILSMAQFDIYVIYNNNNNMIVILIHFDIFQFLGGYYRNQSPPVSYSVPSPCHSRSIFKLQSNSPHITYKIGFHSQFGQTMNVNIITKENQSLTKLGYKRVGGGCKNVWKLFCNR